MKSTWPVTLLAALALVTVHTLFHLTFMQQYLDWDQIVYLNNIRNALQPERLPLLNPHHLHLEIGGAHWHSFILERWGDAGLTDLAFNNRLRSLAAAAVALFFFVLFLREMTGSTLWALAGAILLAGTHGYMAYATKVDTPVFPSATLAMTLWVVQRLEQTRRVPLVWGVLGGVILFLGVMAHQYMAIPAVLGCVALVLPRWLFPDPRRWAPFRRSSPQRDRSVRDIPRRAVATVVMALVGVSLVAGAYFWAGKTVYNLPFAGEQGVEARGPLRSNTFQRWLFLYAGTNMWGRGLEQFDPRAPFRGYTDMFISQPGTVTRFNRNYRFEDGFVHRQLRNMTAFLVAATVILLPALWMRYRRLFVFVLSTAVVKILFTTYWEAYYYEFWIIPGMLLVVLLVMILHHLAVLLNGVTLRGGSLPGVAYLLFLSLVFFNHNVQHYLVNYSRVQRLESYSSEWPESYYLPLFSTDIYLHPQDVHREAFPGSLRSVQ